MYSLTNADNLGNIKYEVLIVCCTSEFKRRIFHKYSERKENKLTIVNHKISEIF